MLRIAVAIAYSQFPCDIPANATTGRECVLCLSQVRGNAEGHTQQAANAAEREDEMSDNNNNTNMKIKWAAKNYGILPKANAVSIQYCGNKGSRKEGTLTVSAFLVMVNIKGTWKSEGVWMHQFGMRTENRRGVYTTIEKAKEAKKRILERWGKSRWGKSRWGKAK